MTGELSEILKSVGDIAPISLEEMDNVKLMNRLDTKFVFSIDQLPLLLEKAARHYRVLAKDDQKIIRYNSLYYDTGGLKSYFDHHNGIRPRYKVRFREYEDTGDVFLEIKKKVANNRTRKTRIEVARIETELSQESMDYIAGHSPFDPAELVPSIWTIFRRITLVGKNNPERITIDIDISFRHLDYEKGYPFLCIAEIKRDRTSGKTEFIKILKESRIYPGSSSKYCLGTILLKSPIKFNRFKRNILIIKKLENVYRSDVPAG